LEKGEFREFPLTPPVVVRFGLGSITAVKEWARFELRHTNDLYWTAAMNVRKDIDKTNTHIAIHRSGEIVRSRYVNNMKVNSKRLGNIFDQKTHSMEIECGKELLEPGYLYHGLKTLGHHKKTLRAIIVECLDTKLVNSRLSYALQIFAETGNKQAIKHAASLGESFCASDRRSHLYIFFWRNMALALSMTFTEGDQPIDVQMVHEADSHPHKLKRLFSEDTL